MKCIFKHICSTTYAVDVHLFCLNIVRLVVQYLLNGLQILSRCIVIAHILLKYILILILKHQIWIYFVLVVSFLSSHCSPTWRASGPSTRRQYHPRLTGARRMMSNLAIVALVAAQPMGGSACDDDLTWIHQYCQKAPPPTTAQELLAPSLHLYHQGWDF